MPKGGFNFKLDPALIRGVRRVGRFPLFIYSLLLHSVSSAFVVRLARIGPAKIDANILFFSIVLTLCYVYMKG